MLLFARLEPHSIRSILPEVAAPKLRANFVAWNYLRQNVGGPIHGKSPGGRRRRHHSRHTLRASLSQYICQTAETAEKAFARLEADPYDVVLTDISMPGLSGLELLGHIRQRFANIPVIIISGIGDQEHAQGLIKLGAFDFLFKPFTLEVVEKSVKRAVEYRKRLLEESAGPQTSDRASNQDEAGDWKIVRRAGRR